MALLVLIIGIIGILILTFFLLIYLSTFHPKPIEHPPVYSSKDAPVLKPGQKIKVMTWNVQFMTGFNYDIFLVWSVNSRTDSTR